MGEMLEAIDGLGVIGTPLGAVDVCPCLSDVDIDKEGGLRESS